MGLTGPAREITVTPTETPEIPDYIEFDEDTPDEVEEGRELVPVGPPEDAD